MKTAISIPDDVFADAERLARVLNAARSQICSRAVREFDVRHSPDRVTATLDGVCADMPEPDDAFPLTAAWHVLRRSGW